MQFSHACFNVNLNRVQEILHEWDLVVALCTIKKTSTALNSGRIN